jgi:hypothetical protein
MNKRKSIILISIFIIVSLLIFWKFIKLNKIYGFIGKNSVNIVVIEPLKKENLVILKSFYSIDRKNDEELFFSEYSKPDTIFNGYETKETKFEYGENDFLIIYNNEYYYEFRQFKTNERAYHDYSFIISKIDTNYIINVEIIGLDDTKFQRNMNKIENAKYLRCNTPVDKAGIIYDMNELIDK